MPKAGSRITHFAPIILVLIDVILGRVPANELYVTDQGSVSRRTVALPTEQNPTLALVMEPITAPAVFVVVADCILPSIVSAQPVVPHPPVSSALDQTTLNASVDTLNRFALATPTSANSMTAAPVAVSDNLMVRM